MRIALIDLQSSGHHEDYILMYARTLALQGHETVCFFPKKLNSPYIKDSFLLPEYKNTYSRMPFYAQAKLLKNWLVVAKALEKSGMHFDFSFFMSIDSFLYDSPRGWMNKLYNRLSELVFPNKWGGLVFEVTQAADPAQPMRGYLFRSPNCRLIGTLDEYAHKGLADKFSKTVVCLPDTPNATPPDAAWEVAAELREKACGKTVIALIGALQKRKGIMPLLRLAKEKKADRRFLFAFCGRVFEDGMDQSELDFIRECRAAKMENCFFYFENIPDEAKFNALIEASDIIYAAYIDFPNSSGLLGKAALFHKPVIVSRGHLMHKRTETYNTGVSLESHSSENIFAAIEKINGQSLGALPDFEGYNNAHSLEKLEEALKTTFKTTEQNRNSMKGYKEHTRCLISGKTDLVPLKGYEKDYLVKSKSSGFVFCSRIPTTDELIAHYGTYPRYDYISELTIKRYEEMFDEFEKYRKTNRILDVGCGVGHFLAVAKKRGWEVHGTEFTDTAIEICEKKGVQMKKGVLDPANYPPESFDIITSFEVIEHINNPVEEVGNFYKLLRPKGLFYFTTPNFNALERRILGPEYPVIEYPEHLSYYTPETIDMLLSSNGFHKIKILCTGVSIDQIKNGLAKRKSRNTPIDEPILPEKTSENPNAEPQGAAEAPRPATGDDALRQMFESKSIMGTLKNAINGGLSLLELGNSMKGYYTKS